MPDVVLRTVALLVAMSAAAANAMPTDPPLQAAARDLVGDGQGVYVEAADGTILATQAADRPVHPASVTKVVSSLALLERLGPEHRFETRISAAGDVRDGRVLGDLVIDAAGDPTLVYENVFLLLAKVRSLGVRGVAGGLAVRGPLLFNWKPDPKGERLQRALAGRDGSGAWAAVRGRVPSRASLREAGLVFEGGDGGTGTGLQALAINQSPPLVRILKWLND